MRLVHDLFGDIPVSTRPAEIFPAALRNPIMQAGYSLTLLDVTYSGTRRRVEPYSLMYKVRRDGAAREYFYVYDRTGGSSGPGIKALVAGGTEHIENTEETFESRFPVEITKAGEISGSLYFEGQRRSRSIFGGVRAPRVRSRQRRTATSSHRYVVQCPVCGKRFRRDRFNIQLKPHKDKYGNQCIGRIGRSV